MATKFGVHEKWTAPDNGRNPAEVQARYPGASIGRAFVSGVLNTVEDLRPKVLSVLQPYLDAGTDIIYVSVKTNIADTRNGLWNARFNELGVYLGQLMAQHNCVIKLVWYHEPEDDMNGTAFAHAFNKVRQHAKTGYADLIVVWSSMAYQWAPNWNNTASIAGKTDDVAAWQNVIADEYATDAYNGRSFPLDQILPDHPGVARWLNLIVGTKPFSVTERGLETPNSAPNPTHNATANYPLRNATIQREFDWIRTNDVGQRCENYIYWNSSGTEESSSLKLDSTGEDTLAAAIANGGGSEPPTEAELQQAYNDGFAAGDTAGYARGYAEGRASRQGEVDTAATDALALGRTQGEAAMKTALSQLYLDHMNTATTVY